MYLICRFASHRCIGVFSSLDKMSEILPKNIDVEHYYNTGDVFLFEGILCFIIFSELNKLVD